jgi:RNA polymerase sigma factor (sigma-70 family)
VLWEKHAPELRRRCVHWMSSPEAGEEAFGRFAVRAVEQYRRFAPEIRDPHAWLVSLARHVCMDMHRSTRQERERRSGAGIEQVIATGGSPEQALLSRERCADLARSINALPRHLREPLILRARDGAAYDDIAQVLRVSEESARKRTSLARQTVRRLLRASHLRPRREAPQSSCTITVTLLADGRVHEVTLEVPNDTSGRTTAWLRSYVAAHAGGWKMRLALARRLLEAADAEGALAQYRAVLALQPQHENAARELAALLRGIGDDPE